MLQRGYERLLLAGAWAAALLIGAMALLIAGDVGLRTAGWGSLPWSVEVAEYILFGATFLAAPWVLREGGHVRVDVLVRLLPALSVLENVMAGGVFGHARRWGPELQDYARAMLAQVGVDGDGQAPVQSLTYIDQKRVELARALVADPKVLLLDEWLAGLNPTELRTGIALIEGLRGDGRAILIVEHVMDAIRSLCGRCVVMNNGIKIAEGTPHDVLSDHDVIAAYLGDGHA